MSSLSDILTAAKNVVTSVNQLGLTYLRVQGAVRSTTMTTATLVTSGQGRLASVSVVVAGSQDCDGHGGKDCLFHRFLFRFKSLGKCGTNGDR